MSKYDDSINCFKQRGCGTVCIAVFTLMFLDNKDVGGL